MRAPLLAAALLACRAGAAGERHEEAAAPRFVATTFSGSGFASPSSTMLVATSADGELFTNIAAGRPTTPRPPRSTACRAGCATPACCAGAAGGSWY